MEKQANALKAQAEGLLNRANTAAQEAAMKAAREAAETMLRRHLVMEKKAQQAEMKAAELRSQAKGELEKAYHAALTTAQAMQRINEAYGKSGYQQKSQSAA